MTSEDVWVETVHESERRDRKRNDDVASSRDKDKGELSAQGAKKRPATRKASPSKGDRAHDRKRAA